MGIEMIGTGALILTAKRKGLFDEIAPLLDSLIDQGYRLSPELLRVLLQRSGES